MCVNDRGDPITLGVQSEVQVLVRALQQRPSSCEMASIHLILFPLFLLKITVVESGSLLGSLHFKKSHMHMYKTDCFENFTRTIKTRNVKSLKGGFMTIGLHYPGRQSHLLSRKVDATVIFLFFQCWKCLCTMKQFCNSLCVLKHFCPCREMKVMHSTYRLACK